MRKVKREQHEIDPQDTLLDSLAQRKDFFGQKRFEVPLSRGVIYGVLVLFVVVTAVLTTRSFWWAHINHDELAELSDRNYKRIYYKQADRGVIYDRNMKQLVFNERRFDLAVYKGDLPFNIEERQGVIDRVSEKSGLPAEEVKKRIENERKDRVLLIKDLPHEQLISLQSANVPSLYIEETIERRYPFGEALSHVMGYLGRSTEEDIKHGYSSLDYLGKSGLESFYEEDLKGVNEVVEIQKDIMSREISRRKISEQQAGQSLVLWLDAELQQQAYDVLREEIRSTGAEGGSVVVLDAKTGGVLSLVSAPSFDNNIFSSGLSDEEWASVFKDPSHPFWNRAIAGVYPSGSTIKPIVATGALEEKMIDPQRVINCPGSIKVENPWHEDQPWIFRDWKVHGPVDMREAIAKSCNVYFYTIGGGHNGIEGLGVDRLNKYLSLFGWGQKTGIDLTGERKGLVPNSEWKREHFEGVAETIWLPGDTYNLSIGQGYLSVSPIQIASSYIPIANGGQLLTPQMVKEVVGGDSFDPTIRRENFVDEESLEVVREGMREAVLYGSSRYLGGFQAASKTGTAQTGQGDNYHNWVALFAPYEDPEIVMVVMVEDVPGEQGAALHVAREVLSWYFR